MLLASNKRVHRAAVRCCAMPFFAPLPRPEDLAEEYEPAQYYAYPWAAPDNVLPGLGDAGVLLARNDTTAVQLAVTGAYRTGLTLVIQARFHPDHPYDQWPPGPGPLRWREDFRFGLEWADGSRSLPVGDEEDDTSASYRLQGNGGGGGGLRYDWDYWLWPLPPPGPATAYVWWESRGIPETAVTIDLAPYVEWAEGASELWPLPEAPQEFGWTAYAPFGGRAQVQAVRSATAGDAPEPTEGRDR